MATSAELRKMSIVLLNHAVDRRASADAARARSRALREQSQVAREQADTARRQCVLAMSRMPRQQTPAPPLGFGLPQRYRLTRGHLTDGKGRPVPI